MMAEQEMTPDDFHGLKGKFKQWTSLGVIGALTLLCVWLVAYQNPATNKTYLDIIVQMQEKAAAELKEERDLSATQQEKSRGHGSQATKDLGEGLKENAKAIQSLNETFIRVQERTQENQRTLIELQLKKIEQDKPK